MLCCAFTEESTVNCVLDIFCVENAEVRAQIACGDELVGVLIDVDFRHVDSSFPELFGFGEMGDYVDSIALIF